MDMRLPTFASAAAGLFMLCACTKQEAATVALMPSVAPAVFSGSAEFVAFGRGYFDDGEMGSIPEDRLVAPEPDAEGVTKLLSTLAQSGWEEAKQPSFEGGVYPCGGNYLVLHLRDGRRATFEVESWGGGNVALFTSPSGDRRWFVLDTSIRQAVFG